MRIPPQTSHAHEYKQQSIVLSLLLVLGAVFGVNSCSHDNLPRQDQAHKFNVVMIVSDALRQDVLGCYRGEAKTPNIDWLAKQGILFDNAYSTSPWTVPSSVSMFSGNYPTIYKNKPFVKSPKNTPLLAQSVQIQVPDSENLLAKSLVKLNYSTRMKIENPNARRHNNMQGFTNLPEAKDFNTAISQENREEIKKIIDAELLNVQSYQQSYIFLEYLRSISPGENFFALYWMEDPHAPYEPIEKFKSRIVVDEKILTHEKSYYATTLPEGNQLSKGEKEYNKELYLAEVESVDERVGFIIKMLQAKNLLGNTIIVFTSDHGEQFGEHNQYGHGGFGRGCNYYEQLVRVPLIIAGPGLSKNKRIKVPVSHLALMPTLKEMLGVQYPDQMQGESYYPLMQERAYTVKPLFFTDVRDNEQVDGVLEDNFKLIALRDGNFKLYDLNADKAEDNSLATQRHDLLQTMRKSILAFRERNLKRLHANLQQPDSVGDSSVEDEQQTVNKLRSLGYIK